MEFFFIIIGIIAILIILWIGTSMERVSCFIGSLSGIVILGSVISLHPTALDVYRGNTRIKYSIEVVNGDTIYSDSTVVWK